MLNSVRSDPNVRSKEVIHEIVSASEFGVIQKKLSPWEAVYQVSALRKGVILVVLALIWEFYARSVHNPLMIPTFSSTMEAFFNGLLSGSLIVKAWTSIQVLLMGYAAGIALAGLFTVIAINSRIGTDLLETLTAMFNPLPSIAILPMAMVWFGLGVQSLVFVLIHSVLWAVALNTHTGFTAVSNTLRMVGRNYGLRGFSYVGKILIPAAFPSILIGLKVGWAFAWRTLIAAELIFGVSSGQGGLGWFIYENKNLMDIPNVFAGLFSVIFIGLIVENLIFRTIETRTLRKWGMLN
jgi:NitT/TauT family transport system permease protein